MTGIEFFRVDAEATLTELLKARDPSRVGEWLHTGSVYLDGQRMRQEVKLRPGQIVRLHTRRKRYPVPNNLAGRVVYRDLGLLVLDKPPGLPVHPTLDNFLENAKYALEEELQAKLYSTHRLDVPTQGLLIFATDVKSQAQMNKLFANRRVFKTYHALTTLPVPEGDHTLFVDSKTRVPRKVYRNFAPGRWECRLSVGRGGTTQTGLHWCRVFPATGKTHQIRLQLAALGRPLVGDETYGSLRPGTLGLECYEMSFRWQGQDLTLTRASPIFETFL